MVKEFDVQEFTNIHDRFKRFVICIAGCTCLIIGVHKWSAMRMNSILRRVYGSYAGAVLDIHPRRIVSDISKFDEFRAHQLVPPIYKLTLLDSDDGQLASVVEGHPAFAFSDIRVEVIKGPPLGGELEHEGHTYHIPFETNSVDTVSCLFGLSKTNRKQFDVVREMCRVCAPMRPPEMVSTPVGNGSEERPIQGRIILLDWSLMPNTRLQAIQRFIFGSAYPGTRTFPKLETVVRANGCVVVRSEKFFCGAVSMVIAQKQ